MMTKEEREQAGTLLLRYEALQNAFCTLLHATCSPLPDGEQAEETLETMHSRIMKTMDTDAAVEACTSFHRMMTAACEGSNLWLEIVLSLHVNLCTVAKFVHDECGRNPDFKAFCVEWCAGPLPPPNVPIAEPTRFVN